MRRTETFRCQLARAASALPWRLCATFTTFAVIAAVRMTSREDGMGVDLFAASLPHAAR